VVRADLAGLSHRGLVRPNNEDHFLISRFGRFLDVLQSNLPAGAVPPHEEEGGYAMIVADGIGGSAAGEVASELAIDTLVHLALSTPDWILRLDDNLFAEEVTRRAKERCDQINAALAERAQADPTLRGFGTTLTVAWSLGQDLFLAHVGDSRAYLLRQGNLVQLTRDHTLVQELVGRGIVAPQEVKTHRLRHVLTNALGSSSPVHPDVERVYLLDGDVLLLCSDGLTEMVADEKIAATLLTGQAAAPLCQQLVDQALQAGGKDNVTVIVARYATPSSP
jgi:protein phosphatase